MSFAFSCFLPWPLSATLIDVLKYLCLLRRTPFHAALASFDPQHVKFTLYPTISHLLCDMYICSGCFTILLSPFVCAFTDEAEKMVIK